MLPLAPVVLFIVIVPLKVLQIECVVQVPRRIVGVAKWSESQLGSLNRIGNRKGALTVRVEELAKSFQAYKDIAS